MGELNRLLESFSSEEHRKNKKDKFNNIYSDMIGAVLRCSKMSETYDSVVKLTVSELYYLYELVLQDIAAEYAEAVDFSRKNKNKRT